MLPTPKEGFPGSHSPLSTLFMPQQTPMSTLPNCTIFETQEILNIKLKSVEWWISEKLWNNTFCFCLQINIDLVTWEITTKGERTKKKKKKPDLNNGKSQNHLRESPYNVNRS